MNDETLDLQLEARAQSASETLLYAEDFLERKKATIEKEAFRLIHAPEGLTPEKALQLWLRMAALYDLVRDLNTALQVGSRATARLAATRVPEAQKAPLP